MPAHAILFENADFQGNHKHVFDHIQNLSNQVDHFDFNDQTSSLVVLEGNWQFFKDWQWQNPWPKIVGPGVYVTITEALGANDANDSITGMRPVDALVEPFPSRECLTAVYPNVGPVKAAQMSEAVQ